MCLLFGMTHTNRLTRRQLNAVLKTVNNIFAPSQTDGFGFAIQNKDGSRYIERYIDPKQFGGVGVAETCKNLMPANLKPAIANAVTGELRQWGGGLIVHGRTSTNDVSLRNTHPFTKNGWTLAHNGVVNWHGKKYPLETTCDTEHILNMFALGGGLADLKDLTGYAACLMLTPDNEFAVFRDSSAPLHFCYVHQLKSTLFATREYILTAVAKALRIKAPYIVAVSPDVFLTFPLNPDAGERFKLTDHDGIKWGRGLGASACRAFGGMGGGWDGEDYHHYGGGVSSFSASDKTTKTAQHEADDRHYDAIARRDAREAGVDLDSLGDDEWNEYLAAREEERKEREHRRTDKSIHTMTQEELERYGL